MRLLPVTDRPGPAVPGRGAAGRAAISAATLVAVMAATMVVAAPTSGAAESDPLTVTPTPAAATETVTETPEPTPTPEPSPAPSEDPVPTTEPTVEPTPTPEPTPAPEPTVTPEPTPTPEPYEPMRLGERSERIRVLESRLHQLGLHSEVITSLFERETRRAVASFKRSQKLKGRRGVVDERSWNRLVSLTRTPTADELNNVYTPGPAILKRGMRSGRVRHLEARLSQVKKFRGRVGARYDRKTQRAVRAFQKSVKIPVTGAVDARTRDRLHAATRRPTRSELRNWGFNLDPRCLSGRVMCIDKTTRSLKWVVGGEVKMRLDARFGDPYYPTRQGTFSVFKKSRDHVSSIYHTPMPFAMFFSGGQAVHYSPDFKANGYDGHSHGCVNIRHRKAIARLFDWVSLGDRVVVFRS